MSDPGSNAENGHAKEGAARASFSLDVVDDDEPERGMDRRQDADDVELGLGHDDDSKPPHQHMHHQQQQQQQQQHNQHQSEEGNREQQEQEQHRQQRRGQRQSFDGHAVPDEADGDSWTSERGSNDEHIAISFCNLSYSVMVDEGARLVACWRRKKRMHVIRGISGRVHYGEMMGILGPTGVGKSTLLDILASSQMEGVVSGEIHFHAQAHARDESFTYLGYMSKDVLIWSLTVRETLMWRATLVLPTHIARAERVEIVEDLLRNLNLVSCANTQIGDLGHRGISTGEKRRLSIALEMIPKPKILLLDEPTSGLDARTASDVVLLLKGLAKKQNMAIVCVIHQPRPSIFFMFNSVIALGARWDASDVVMSDGYRDDGSRSAGGRAGGVSSDLEESGSEGAHHLEGGRGDDDDGGEGTVDGGEDVGVGRQVFFGDPNDLLPYFRAAGVVDSTTNPADLIMDLCGEPSSDNRPSKSTSFISPLDVVDIDDRHIDGMVDLHGTWEASINRRRLMARLRADLTTSPSVMHLNNLASVPSSSMTTRSSNARDAVFGKSSRCRSFIEAKDLHTDPRRPGRVYQAYYLFWRQCLVNYRQYSMIINVIETVVPSLLIGWMAFQTQSERQLTNVIYFSTIFLMFFSIAALVRYSLDRDILLLEGRHYHLISHYVAYGVLEIASSIFRAIWFSSVMYWMVGLAPDVSSFAYFLVVAMVFMVLMAGVIEFVGLATDSIHASISVIMVTFSVMTIFAGFFFPRLDAPGYLQWIFWLSPAGTAWQGLMVNEYDGRRVCAEDEDDGDSYAGDGNVNRCIRGSDYLDDLDIEILPPYYYVLVLMGWLLLVRVLEFMALWKRKRLVRG